MDEKLIKGFIADKLGGINDVDSIYKVFGQIWDILLIEVEESFAEYADYDYFESSSGVLCGSCVTSKVVYYLHHCYYLQTEWNEDYASGEGYGEYASEEGHGEYASEEGHGEYASEEGHGEYASEGPYESCGKKTHPTSQDEENQYPLPEDDQDLYPWLNDTSYNKCDGAYEKFQKLINRDILRPYVYIRNHGLSSIALDIKFGMSRNTHPREQDICFHLLSKGNTAVSNFLNVLGLIEDVLLCSKNDAFFSMEELMFEIQLFGFGFRKPVGPSPNFAIRVTETCTWWREASDTLHEKGNKYRANIARVLESLLEAETTLSEFLDRMFYFWDSDTFLINKMAQYLAKNISKQELTMQFFSDQGVKEREDFAQGKAVLESLLHQYENKLLIISGIIRQGYAIMRDLNPVIIDDNNVQKLQLVKKALTVDSLAYHGREGNLNGIINKFPELIQNGPIADLQQKVIEPILAMQQQLKIVETNLREYQESIKMDSQFYL